MEGIFETVTVTVRVTVYLKHIEISGEDSIVVLSCKKFRYGKWKILKMSPEADQNPSNEEREIERQRRKVIHEKNYTRMTSRCKRIGMIRYSFLKQEDKYREIDQEPIRSRASQIALQKLQEYTRNFYYGY